MELPKRTVGNGIHIGTYRIGSVYRKLSIHAKWEHYSSKIVFNAYLIAAKYVINSIQYVCVACMLLYEYDYTELERLGIASKMEYLPT